MKTFCSAFSYIVLIITLFWFIGCITGPNGNKVLDPNVPQKILDVTTQPAVGQLSSLAGVYGVVGLQILNLLLSGWSKIASSQNHQETQTLIRDQAKDTVVVPVIKSS